MFACKAAPAARNVTQVSTRSVALSLRLHSINPNFRCNQLLAGHQLRKPMDHSGMDHGDMDMGGDQCSMNVGQLQRKSGPVLTYSDAIYLVLKKPVHYLSSVARHWHLLAHLILDCNHSPDGRLRMRSRYQQKIRVKPQCTAAGV